ncbi:hypothetical protein KKB44_03125 [Candidatus Micrarchaeota archaeon]|nr:hypothetical protein [Candidatus Micrarchaeota archaeon]
MQSNTKMTNGSYRSLALNYVYILAKKKKIPLRDFSQEELQKLGIVKITNAFGCIELGVSIPKDLDGETATRRIRVFRELVDANRDMLIERPRLVVGAHKSEERTIFGRFSPLESDIMDCCRSLGIKDIF